MKSPKVSIIVPVYNAEETILNSLNSARNQALSDIEIICIDNNSTDESVKIIRDVMAFDDRVKIIHEKKQGSGPARNKGLKEAKGEYIFFLDPDDSIYNSNTLKKLYDLAQKQKMTIVGGSVLIIDKHTEKEHIGEDKYYFKKDGVVKYKDYQYDWGFWRFLYNRQFLKENKIDFPSYARGQDIVFFVKAMVVAGKFYAIKDYVYQYNFDFSGKNYSRETYLDYEKANLNVIEIARRHDLGELEKNAQEHRIPLVSIIIPVFNTDLKGLAQCFQSVRGQAYKNTEVIIVDDGSDKEIADYIDDYALESGWKVIHQKNKGLSAARNSGYKLATGEYVQFLDSDDYFNSKLISSAVALAKRTNAEIVVENFSINNFQNGHVIDALNPDIFPEKETFMLSELPYGKIGAIPFSVWSKLFLKSFLDKYKITHDEALFRSEDVLFSYTALLLAKRITVLQESYITYIEGAPNTNTATNDKYPTDSVKAWRKLYNFLINENLYQIYKNDFEQALTGSLCWHLRRLHTAKGKKELGVAAQKLMSNISVSIKNEDMLALLLASVDVGYLELVDEKDRLTQELQTELNRLNIELNSFLSIKRSVRLVAGNLKRRLGRYMSVR